MSTVVKSCAPLGPLGFPLSEKQARNLDTLLKALPKSKEFEYRKTVFLKAPTELNPGERSDVYVLRQRDRKTRLVAGERSAACLACDQRGETRDGQRFRLGTCATGSSCISRTRTDVSEMRQ